MKFPRKNKRREERIGNEIVVDCYDGEEQAMGWYCYLEENIEFPVLATCISERQISPLRKNDEVTIINMASEDECDREMFVAIEWANKPLAVPLAQLSPVLCSDGTKEAIADWHYWVEQGYEFA